jgi:Protein of unknown function (DUF4242)
VTRTAACGAQVRGNIAISQGREEVPLKQYVVECDMPRVGSFGVKQWREAARKSNEALHELGPDIQWVRSYVAADKLFSVYRANDEEIVRRHAELSGFPVNKVTEISRVIDHMTAAR